jgi:hypothetical protein
MEQKPDRMASSGRLFAALLLLTTLHAPFSKLFAQNTTMTYQGRVTDNGNNFNGSGSFKFALVTSTNASAQATATANLTGSFVTSCSVMSGGNGYTAAPAVTFSGGGGSGATATAMVSGGVVTAVNVNNAGSGYTSAPSVTIASPPDSSTFVTYWSNDGTSAAGSEPNAAVNVNVANGLFTVVLGDTTLANMAAIDTSVFCQPNLQLRIWFNDGVHGSAALSPVQNLTSAPYASVATTALGLAGVVKHNTIGSNQNATVGGGYGNFSTNIYTTVGGGYANIANGSTATVGGGGANLASGPFAATVGGGYANVSSGTAATIAGGYQNWSAGNYAAIGGGLQNSAAGAGAVVGGGGYNGSFNYAGNLASGVCSTISGGYGNTNAGNYSTICGGAYNFANSSGYATMTGGSHNNCSGYFGTVCGGNGNTAAGDFSFAAGRGAQALHTGSFVWADSSGGFSSTAQNQFAVRAAGGLLFAGDVAFDPSAYHHLSLSGGNSTGFLYGAYENNTDGISLSYNYYASAPTGGGHVIRSDGPTSRVTVGYGSIELAVGGVGSAPSTVMLRATTSGVCVNGTVNNCSDRNVKQDFAPVSPSEILDRVAQLPVSEWSYKMDATTRHIGPMAQDFYAAFNVGSDDKHIAPIDESGVALAAIQALNQKLHDKESEIEMLKERLDKLEHRNP